MPPFIANAEKKCELDSDFDGIPDSKVFTNILDVYIYKFKNV